MSRTGSWLERAARLGGYLRAAGAGPETVVGLCLDRGPELVTAIVAMWLAGAAYLPLDPGYPAERLGFMLADARAAVLAGTGAALADVPAGRVRLVETGRSADGGGGGRGAAGRGGAVPGAGGWRT